MTGRRRDPRPARTEARISHAIWHQMNTNSDDFSVQRICELTGVLDDTKPPVAQSTVWRTKISIAERVEKIRREIFAASPRLVGLPIDAQYELPGLYRKQAFLDLSGLALDEESLWLQIKELQPLARMIMGGLKVVLLLGADERGKSRTSTETGRAARDFLAAVRGMARQRGPVLAATLDIAIIAECTGGGEDWISLADGLVGDTADTWAVEAVPMGSSPAPSDWLDPAMGTLTRALQKADPDDGLQVAVLEAHLEQIEKYRLQRWLWRAVGAAMAARVKDMWTALGCDVIVNYHEDTVVKWCLESPLPRLRRPPATHPTPQSVARYIRADAGSWLGRFSPALPLVEALGQAQWSLSDAASDAESDTEAAALLAAEAAARSAMANLLSVTPNPEEAYTTDGWKLRVWSAWINQDWDYLMLVAFPVRYRRCGEQARRQPAWDDVLEFLPVLYEAATKTNYPAFAALLSDQAAEELRKGRILAAAVAGRLKKIAQASHRKQKPYRWQDAQAILVQARTLASLNPDEVPWEVSRAIHELAAVLPATNPVPRGSTEFLPRPRVDA